MKINGGQVLAVPREPDDGHNAQTIVGMPERFQSDCGLELRDICWVGRGIQNLSVDSVSFIHDEPVSLIQSGKERGLVYRTAMRILSCHQHRGAEQHEGAPKKNIAKQHGMASLLIKVHLRVL